MAIDYDVLKNWRIADSTIAYEAKDCMLYAQSLGYGHDALDPAELPFVYEDGIRLVPSLFTVIGAPGAWATDPGTGIDWLRILHGEHRLTIHALPAAQGVMKSATRVTCIVDKGPGRGALVVTGREVTCADTGKALATIAHTSFCRADGGIGRSDEAPPALAAAPARPADHQVLLATLPSAALLYRLNGDRNPIHVDPAMARKAGFDRPILHGLCSYGMACRAVLRASAGNDPARLASFALRFSAPMYPGETLRVDIWNGEGGVHFEAFAHERQVKVLSHGFAGLQFAGVPAPEAA